MQHFAKLFQTKLGRLNQTTRELDSQTDRYSMPPKSSGRKPYKDPLQVHNTLKIFDDPVKAHVVEQKPYEDPLRVRPKSFKAEPIKWEYKPYNSFHVFKPSNIDPLTGRPYRQHRRKQEKEIEEPEPEKDEPPVSLLSAFFFFFFFSPNAR